VYPARGYAVRHTKATRSTVTGDMIPQPGTGRAPEQDIVKYERAAATFQFEFFRQARSRHHGGGLCGLLGVYIVLRGSELHRARLSHAIFGGAVRGIRDDVGTFKYRARLWLPGGGLDQSRRRGRTKSRRGRGPSAVITTAVCIRRGADSAAPGDSTPVIHASLSDISWGCPARRTCWWWRG